MARWGKPYFEITVARFAMTRYREARATGDEDEEEEDDDDDDGDDDEDEDDDNDDDDENNRKRPVSGHAKANNGDNAYNDDSNNNKDSEGLIEHYRSRRRDQKVEHRRHRGVMQFKVSPPSSSLKARSRS